LSRRRHTIGGVALSTARRALNLPKCASGVLNQLNRHQSVRFTG
jgi:hypothetical protein